MKLSLVGASLIALLPLVLSSRVASARATSELNYRLDEVFSTAQRYVRVDRGCKITDRDADSAFVIFECPVPGDDKKVTRGALELFRTEQRGREGVRMQVTLSDDPHGAEIRFLELLERKLREERGLPRESKPPAPSGPPDAGTSKPLPF